MLKPKIFKDDYPTPSTITYKFQKRLILSGKRKPNVSLADPIRFCPFTQGHSRVFLFFVVFTYGL